MKSLVALCLLGLVAVAMSKRATIKSSVYQVPCTGPCDFDEGYVYSYSWCNTDNGWDYCSPSSDVSYYGNNCAQACAQSADESYTACVTEDGSDEYCSLTTQN